MYSILECAKICIFTLLSSNFNMADYSPNSVLVFTYLSTSDNISIDRTTDRQTERQAHTHTHVCKLNCIFRALYNNSRCIQTALHGTKTYKLYCMSLAYHLRAKYAASVTSTGPHKSTLLECGAHCAEVGL